MLAANGYIPMGGVAAADGCYEVGKLWEKIILHLFICCSLLSQRKKKKRKILRVLGNIINLARTLHRGPMRRKMKGLGSSEHL